MITFSVIVPLYNKALFVRKALTSIEAQTYRNFELIVVNDGSTDGSAAIAEAYLKNRTKLDYRILNQSNSGVAAARNNGVVVSKGEFVCFLDADDWWEPDFLEEMDNLIAEYPDAGIDYPEAYLQSGSMPVTSITTCMPRKVFDEMGGFPLGIKLGEDFLLWAKTALHYPVAFSEKPLAYYNNDVPASLRATRNLHAPEYHMLFHLDPIVEEIHKTSNIKHQTSHTVHRTPYTIHRDAWMRLLDKLRVSGLMEYWLSEKYHEAAAAELAKVDWSKQPKSAKAQYEKPIWFLKAKRRFMRIGSYCKQKLIRLKYK